MDKKIFIILCLKMLFIKTYVLILYFSPTLYVGEYEHGTFATASLVDEKTVTIAVCNFQSTVKTATQK